MFMLSYLVEGDFEGEGGDRRGGGVGSTRGEVHVTITCVIGGTIIRVQLGEGGLGDLDGEVDNITREELQRLVGIGGRCIVILTQGTVRVLGDNLSHNLGCLVILECLNGIGEA